MYNIQCAYRFALYPGFGYIRDKMICTKMIIINKIESLLLKMCPLRRILNYQPAYTKANTIRLGCVHCTLCTLYTV